jgi:hypothetical protein
MDPVTLGMAAAAAKRTYAPAMAEQVYNANNLRRWFAALGDAQFGTASIAIVGDSIATGAYANNIQGQYGVPDETIFAQRGYVGLLRSLFATQYGDPGEGIIQPTDKRVTYAGSGSSAFGTVVTLHGSGCFLDSATGRSVTIALPACTAFDILMWTNYGASASFIYTIDGGSNQTAPASPTGTANVAYKISVTGQTNAAHTLILNAPVSGGGCFWYGVDVKGASATGVRVHRLAKSGAKTPDALDIGLTAIPFN